MKSSVVERSRVSVEDAFWKGLQEIIVKRRDEPLSDWPAPGSEDTELGVLMELEVGHGETEVYPRVQA